jgi:hypothetical protein
MNRSSPPKKQPLPFGTNGQREKLLEDTPAGDNTASYSKGFPPVTMILKAAGGLPPKGQDMNQILFELSDLMRWASTGAINSFDPAFSSAISGYPSGALVLSDAGDKIFISVIDNNTDNPNSTNTGSWKNAADFIGVSESVQQEIDGKLAKDQNGADIPDKNQFVKNLDLTETVDCAKNALDKRTGGTVNGDMISQGGQITLKGDDRKHFILANSDGKVRADIWKDKGGDGIHINNGIDGGGDYIFHKDGGFRAPSSVYAGAARIASDGNIYGSMWGNQWLDAYLKKTFQPKGAGQAYTKEESDARYVQDVKRGAVSAIYTPESRSTDAPKGCVMVGVTLSSDGSSGTHVHKVRYCPLQIKINGAWRTISDISDSK